MSFGGSITRIEPPSWWVGMKDNSLQLMLYGLNISDYILTTNSKHIKIERHHRAKSANYLFVDITIHRDASPGEYSFVLKNGKTAIPFKYTLDRRDGREISSFSPSDMVYLIMPDRFVNGDPSNDTHSEAKEKANRLEHYGRHGGDIAGMINSLDYLQELGVTALWSTPLLFDNEPTASYHGYACADYYRIDPRFGTNELYREFVNSANKRGIKIIKDLVPNHCGMEHWWISDLPFDDWIHTFPSFTRSNYAMTTHHDIYASNIDNRLCVKGWFDTSMPDMNLNNPFVLKYFTQNAIWWIEWASLSGLRIDTFPYSDKYAMSSWIGSILKEYPTLNIVGECWFSTSQEIAYWEGGANNRDGYNSNLPSVMDFQLQEAIGSAFKEDGTPEWGKGMFRIYRSLSMDAIYREPGNLMIFADNHDTHRIAEIVGKDPNKIKMLLTLLATMRGVPQIYYGTELMLTSKDGKLGHGEERVNMPGGWSGDSINVFTGEGISETGRDLLDYFKSIFIWRKGSEVIHNGKMKHYWPNHNLYVYFRYNHNKSVMVVINNNTKELELDWKLYEESTSGYSHGKDIIWGKEIKIGEILKVPPQTSMVFELSLLKTP